MKKTWIIVLLIAVLAGIGLVAASCSRFPQLLPVQAAKGTPTAALPATGNTAVIEIAPTQGGPGSRITVAGRGWQPGDTVFIRLENPDTGETPGLDQASAIVTDAGEFSAKFTYPSDSRWANLPRVSIIVSDPTQDLRVSAQFSLTGAALPTLTSTDLPTAASPTATAAGAALTATQAPSTATRPAPTATRVPPTATPAPTMTQAPATATSLPPTATPVVITHWRGEYYANLDLTGQPVAVRDDWSIDFSWGSGAPASGVPANDFSARWTRTLDFEAGTYRFYLSVDDGARLWVDGRLLIDEWRDSSAREVTTEIALGAGSHALRLEYYERTGQARAQLRWERLTTVSYPDWKGEYWANLNLAGAVVLTRNDRILRFDWGSTAPAAGLPADGFSARWTRQAAFAPGIYRLFAQADDGVRVYVDGRLVLNEWHDGRTTEPYTADLELTGTHTVVVEYYERTGGAFVSFWWDQVPPLPLIDPRPGVPLPGKKITPIPPLPMPSEATPAAPAARATPIRPLSVRLNEVLPLPGRADWDGNKKVTARDEWIELTNPSRQAVDLSGWTLEVSGDRGAKRTFRIPQRTTLLPGGFLVFYDQQTKLSMEDMGGLVSLYDARGKLMDTVRYGALMPGSSYSLGKDGVWRADLQPSPGKTNVSLSTSTAPAWPMPTVAANNGSIIRP